MSQSNELLPTTFTDSTGMTWTVPCDVNVIVRVAQRTGIKLTDLVNPHSESHRKWTADFPVTQVAVLYALVEDEARQRDMSPEDVGKRLADQETFDGALRAVLNAVVNFSHPSRRQFLREAIPQAEAAFDRVRDREAMALSETLPKVDWDRLMTDLLTDSASATDSPESSASTPAPAHSGN